MSCLLSLLFYYVCAWLLCDIEPGKEYTWYSGIWHGWFFLPNLVRHWFTGALYKADFYTPAYNVWYWVVSISTVLSTLFKSSDSSR